LFFINKFAYSHAADDCLLLVCYYVAFTLLLLLENKFINQSACKFTISSRFPALSSTENCNFPDPERSKLQENVFPSSADWLQA